MVQPLDMYMSVRVDMTHILYACKENKQENIIKKLPIMLYFSIHTHTHACTHTHTHACTHTHKHTHTHTL